MYLASISNELNIYECESWTRVFNYGNHDSLLRHIEWSTDGKYFLQVNPAGMIEILSATEDGVRCLQCIPEDESSAGAFHSGGHRQVAIGCRSGRIFIWDTKFKSVVKRFTDASSTVKLIDFNSKNTHLAAALDDGDAAVYSVTNNQHVGNIKIPFSNKVSVVKFHNELRSILGLASDEGCVLLRDLGTGKNKMFMKDAHKSVVSGIAFSQVNQDVMISSGYDKKTHIYDFRKQLIVSSIVTDCALTCVDINTENFVALGNKKGQLLVYDLRNFVKPLHTFTDHKSIITKVGFQPEVAKRKRFLTLDVSLKESCSPKISSAQRRKECKTPDSVRSYDYIEQFNSPIIETISPIRERGDAVNASKDSFLVNIVGNIHESEVDYSQHSGIKITMDGLSLQKKQDGTLKQKLLTSNIDKKVDGGTSASTPITGRMVSTLEGATPSPMCAAESPIYRNEMSDYEMNENPNIPKYRTSPIKKTDSVDSVSVVETVKYAANTVTELGNELKDFITFSIYDVLEQSKNNFMQMTLQQTKNRLFLEDQISNLAQQVKEIQKTQNILIEENKKLSIEVEMLRAFKK